MHKSCRVFISKAYLSNHMFKAPTALSSQAELFKSLILFLFHLSWEATCEKHSTGWVLNIGLTVYQRKRKVVCVVKTSKFLALSLMQQPSRYILRCYNQNYRGETPYRSFSVLKMYLVYVLYLVRLNKSTYGILDVLINPTLPGVIFTY